MNRRSVLTGAAAAVLAAGPLVPAATATTVAPTFEAVQWLLAVQALSHDQRKLYVALLRREPYYRSSAQFAELVDFLDGMNERGSFT